MAGVIYTCSNCYMNLKEEFLKWCKEKHINPFSVIGKVAEAAWIQSSRLTLASLNSSFKGENEDEETTSPY